MVKKVAWRKPWTIQRKLEVVRKHIQHIELNLIFANLKSLPKWYFHLNHHDILTSSLRSVLLTYKDLNGPSLHSLMFLHWLENIMFPESRWWITMYKMIFWNRLKPKFPHSTSETELHGNGRCYGENLNRLSLHMYRDFLNYLWWEERVVFASWRNVQNKDGDEKGRMKYCLGTVKMMIEWWSKEGHRSVQEEKRESKYYGNEFFPSLGGIPKVRIKKQFLLKNNLV